jgi:hypothetical protein
MSTSSEGISCSGGPRNAPTSGVRSNPHRCAIASPPCKERKQPSKSSVFFPQFLVLLYRGPYSPVNGTLGAFHWHELPDMSFVACVMSSPTHCTSISRRINFFCSFIVVLSLVISFSLTPNHHRHHHHHHVLTSWLTALLYLLDDVIDASMSAPPITAARSQTSQRGGFCVHKVSSASDEYLLQAQYLMHPDLAQPPHTHADEGWKQEMIRQNATGGRRGRNKRPLDSHPTSASWTTAAASSASVPESNNVMEDRECMYEYLQTRHDGKGPEAELCIRVHLQSGKGELWEAEQTPLHLDIIMPRHHGHNTLTTFS